jgi:aryl carrier-like protein
MWYRKAIDTSKPPFEIQEPEVQMHPLLKKLHERIEAGEMNETEFFPTLVAMAKDFPEILDSVSPPLKATISGILNQSVQPVNFLEDLLTRGLDYMHPLEIDEVQERLKENGISIDAKEREIIPIFRKIANKIDSEWYEMYENAISEPVDNHFKNFIVYKIPALAFQLSSESGQKFDKDKLEDFIMSESYNNDEEVRNKLEIIFMKIYLESKR